MVQEVMDETISSSARKKMIRLDVALCAMMLISIALTFRLYFYHRTSLILLCIGFLPGTTG
jgi:hypothetical protein